MWFVGPGMGIFREKDGEFTRFNMDDGLPTDNVRSIHEDPDGSLWFGTFLRGVYKYDGKRFEACAELKEIAGENVQAIHRDPYDIMWFGTSFSGLIRYDGSKAVRFTAQDGLADGPVLGLHGNSDGILWIATLGGGVSQYDGERFRNFTVEDGLAHNTVWGIYGTSDELIWAGTDPEGVSYFDGHVWTSLDTRDGLAGKLAPVVYEDREGNIWIGTHGGLTRYRRSHVPPKVLITSVTTDQTYSDLSTIPSFAPKTRITINYKAIDFKTIPEKRQYRYRIKELDNDWRKPTRDDFFDHAFTESGTYIFEVQTIDRDLNYSEPASLELRVISPFYMRAVFLVPAIGFGAIMLAVLAILATALTRRKKQVHAYERMAVQELQDAREMQLSLLPEASPQVEDIEITGRSITANTVGGDFYDYLPLPDGKTGIAMADVSGKGLRAAMNAAMAAGILHDATSSETSCGSILSRLNAHLYPLMEKHMFTAFSFAIIDADSGVIQWSSAAQPLPILRRGNGASEVLENGELPLGMMPNVEYPDYQLELQPSDIVIFYTDGIIEAENEAEEMYGTERLIDLVAGIDSSASAEDVIEAILQNVSQFVGSAEQYDDMTIVVIRKTREDEEQMV